jgi:cytochrome c556
MRGVKLGLLAASLIAIPVAVSAAVPEIIKARQAQFKSVGAAIKAVGDEVRKGDPAVAVIRTNATALHTRLTGATHPRNFPRGSGKASGVTTEAGPDIWTKPAEFAAKRRAALAATDALKKAAATGDIAKIRPAVGAVGAGCKGCHDQFRVKD